MVPRGGTALLDAVGRAINETGARLDKLSDAEKPGLVIFMIITDGEENSSKEFTNAQINKMIIHQQEKYKWEFSFLGADQDSFSVARTLGINSKGVSNYNKANPMNVFRNASIMASSARNSSIVGEAVNYSYTQDMREDNMKGKENKDDTSDLIAKFGQNGQKILDYVDLVNVITP